MILLKPIRLDKKIYQFYYGHVILLNTIHTLKSPRRPFKGFWSQRKVLIVLFLNYYPLFFGGRLYQKWLNGFSKKIESKNTPSRFFFNIIFLLLPVVKISHSGNIFVQDKSQKTFTNLGTRPVWVKYLKE